MFNAVIVLVSHVVDPAYSNDRAALAKVDTALHMIKTMSNNHAFAQRAYSFLQQVLGYMHQSIAVCLDKEDQVLTGALPPTPPTGTLAADIQDDAEPIPNLHALFGFTQDLTNNLEIHLENFGTRGLVQEPWSFSDQLFN